MNIINEVVKYENVWKPSKNDFDISFFSQPNTYKSIVNCYLLDDSPFGFELVSKTWSCWGCCVKVYTLIIVSKTTTILEIKSIFCLVRSGQYPYSSSLQFIGKCHEWTCSYRSLLRRTERTSDEKSSSMTCFFFKSSQTMTERERQMKNNKDKNVGAQIKSFHYIN